MSDGSVTVRIDDLRRVVADSLRGHLCDCVSCEDARRRVREVAWPARLSHTGRDRV